MSEPVHSQHIEQLDANGCSIIPQCLSQAETEAILHMLHSAAHSATPHAIRHVLAEIPEITTILAGSQLVPIINKLFDAPWFIVKSMLFDKPADIGWLVNRHQDAIINTENTGDIPGFTAWKKRPWGYSVQPPAAWLENIITVRIHLDDCDENNGALRVLPGTHRQGIVDVEEIRTMDSEQESLCAVRAGGALLMKPLLIHASAKNASGRPRRVLHLECTTQELPPPLQWSEHIFLC